MVVEVTRMPMYNNALGSVPTQYFLLFKYLIPTLFSFLLPARASEQGNVIGSVRIYVMCVQKNIVIERTRDLNYLKFVVTDLFPKIISPSAGENSGDIA